MHAEEEWTTSVRVWVAGAEGGELVDRTRAEVPQLGQPRPNPKPRDQLWGDLGTVRQDGHLANGAPFQGRAAASLH